MSSEKTRPEGGERAVTQENTEEREFTEKFLKSLDAEEIDLKDLTGGKKGDEEAYLRWQADQETRERRGRRRK